MRLSFKNKSTPENIRVKITAKNNSSIKIIGDVTAPGNNPTMVLNGGELVFCLAPVLTQGVWVLNTDYNITDNIVTYTAYKNIRSTKYYSHANLELFDPIIRSLTNQDMRTKPAVTQAIAAIGGTPSDTQIAEHILSDTSTASKEYKDEIADSIYTDIKFITLDDLTPQFEEHIIRVEYQGVKEEHVKVNKYTTSALDFEHGLSDKISNTFWKMSGNYLLQSTNVLSSTSSLETKYMGDSLYSEDKLLSGNNVPFTVEFEALVKGVDQPTDSQYIPLFVNHSRDQNLRQGLHRHKTNGNLIYYSNFQTYHDIILNKKINYNEINKFTITYDTACLRIFINEQLESVIGQSNFTVQEINTFFSAAGDSRVLRGILDNVNIFDGEAKLVRDYDEHADKLVVDLSFDGENNSTRIVDNGLEKTIWSSYSAYYSTNQNFDGYSSLYLNGYSSYLTSNSNFSLSVNDFTINLELYATELPSRVKPLFKTVSNPNKPYTFGCAIEPNNSLQFYIYNETYNGFVAVLNTNPDLIKINKTTKVSVILQGITLSLYLDNIFITSTTLSEPIKHSEGNPLFIGYMEGGNGDRFFPGYIKNFKIYKDVAIIPESPVGKIQLDFNNNLDDKYNNSTWVNNGVTFDQVNSVKGHAAYFPSNNQRITSVQNSNFNFERNNFFIELDAKALANRGTYAEIFSSGQSSWQNGCVAIGWHNNGTMRMTSYFNNIDTNVGSITLPNDSYYNINYKRINNNMLLKVNDVLTSIYNLDNNITFNFNDNNNTCIGHAIWSGSNGGFKGYIDNFKAIKNCQEETIIDRPAVHLPLETNSINIGFTNLSISQVGYPTYTVIDNKKCIKFEQGKYLNISSNNIFNLGSSSDFYIEFDFKPITDKYHYVLSNNASNISTLTGICFSKSTEPTISNVVYFYAKGTYLGSTSNKYDLNSFNNLKFRRKGEVTTVELNGVKSIIPNGEIDFSGTSIGNTLFNSTSYSDGYMSNFKMFVGTSEIPETYNDKKVLDLDFKPTRKSYLFKDNNNKCVIHPVNINYRDYQDSQYCCTFNGVDQYIQLGKNDLLNFGSDDFILNIKFKISNAYSGWQMLMCDNLNSVNYIDLSNATKFIAIKLGGVRYDTPPNTYNHNEIIDLLIQAKDSMLTVKVNGVQITLNGLLEQPLSSANLNENANTFIGQYYNGTERFNGTLYSIKVLRNTSDVSLLEDVWVDPFPPEPEVPPFEEGVLNFTELLKDVDPHNVVLDFNQLRNT